MSGRFSTFRIFFATPRGLTAKWTEEDDQILNNTSDEKRATIVANMLKAERLDINSFWTPINDGMSLVSRIRRMQRLAFEGLDNTSINSRILELRLQAQAQGGLNMLDGLEYEALVQVFAFEMDNDLSG